MINSLVRLGTAISRSQKPTYHPKIPVMYYHSIGDTELSIPVDIFRRHMKYLKEKEFTTISLDKLAESIKLGNDIAPKSIVITFDDGFEDTYINAYPILKEFGFLATFFIAVDYVDKVRWGSPLTQRWVDGEEPGMVPFRMMSWAQIGDLSNNGMCIGAHTCSHPNLTEIPLEKVMQEVSDSKRILEERLRRPVTMFCYPRGLFNESIIEIVKQCGFEGACSTLLGANDQGVNPYALRRFPGGSSQSDFIAIAEGTHYYHRLLYKRTLRLLKRLKNLI